MEATQVVAVVVAVRHVPRVLGYRVEEEGEGELEGVGSEDLLGVLEPQGAVWDPPGRGVEFERLSPLVKLELLRVAGIGGLTVLRSEQSTESTTCLSEHVHRYVSTLTPRCGSAPGVMYMLFPTMVSSSLSISILLLSNSLVVATDVLHPTPLCHIAYVTFGFPCCTRGSVSPEKNMRSTSVSTSSSASGLASSNSSSLSLGVLPPPSPSPSASASASASLSPSPSPPPSKSTSFATADLRVRFLLAPQKNLSSHGSSASDSYTYGRMRVSTRMQLRASRSGASSGSGNDGWLRRMKSRDVTASMSVSRFSSALSRVRRTSAAEKRLKTSSGDSGSSQNCGHGRAVSARGVNEG